MHFHAHHLSIDSKGSESVEILFDNSTYHEIDTNHDGEIAANEAETYVMENDVLKYKRWRFPGPCPNLPGSRTIQRGRICKIKAKNPSLSDRLIEPVEIVDNTRVKRGFHEEVKKVAEVAKDVVIIGTAIGWIFG